MDIIDFAMKMELDGKEFYEKQAMDTANPELKKILLQLAEEEGRHYEYFRRLKEDESDLSGGALLAGNTTLENVKNIFEQMAENSEKKSFGEDDIAVWRQALRTEEKSEAFYMEKAAQEPNAERKNLLLKIAREENNHVQMIDGVLMYLKHPDTFADSAQFKNFRSLEGW
ncbi:MAG: ferritin family protein [Candidatus Zixiibacteriota bacterium]|nr:MAG: ferritin family protein [candidate division Zixibacteria bacterium]